MIRLDIARTDQHIRGILELQRRNHAHRLSPADQAQSGFVYAEHTHALLKDMAARLPQAIALDGDKVVGYCLAMTHDFDNALPELAPMFAQFSRCEVDGRPLSVQAFFVGGQVCVDAAYRGQGLMGRLYHQLRDVVPPHFELCVTEIATRNAVSVRAHRKIGFVPIARYADAKEEWVIVAWPLRAGSGRRK